MTQTAIVFGAGAGLGKAMARRFGKEGFKVFLVARNVDRLNGLVAELSADGLLAEAVAADLSRPGEAARVVERVKAEGRVEALYYGPTSAEDFTPAFTIGLDAAQTSVNLLYLGLVAAIEVALPDMRRQGRGVILAALGGSAAMAMPFMSGPGPAMAAARNHLQALHGEVRSEGVFVGLLTLSAIIRESAYHARIASGELKMDLPEGFVIPEIEPNDLADRLWIFARQGAQAELTYPQR